MSGSVHRKPVTRLATLAVVAIVTSATETADRCANSLPPEAIGKLRWFAAMAARARRAPVPR